MDLGLCISARIVERHDGAISEPERKYGIHGFPTKILIDPSGKIIGRYHSATEAEATELDQTLAKIFNGFLVFAEEGS